ncbi:Predicted Fe-Mo cluster-binding protein, NifX family [Desulfacinum hydrothermale DSM 13146]|uniref:Predicted Fe-Mo cluster-binding protein, NifX family n=1 Tax=Desulfacinum hydrothermale DSM 13146 TaxID=1121390 RepID=A0A1W1X4R0_9BACT|nr:NifB/NifX family molybdenum-iron cluster-binding protein [Desulfacinum hydrothermale]SMC18885.1 Predicted Fe-Mo cluster-binding protein, NifX family [Desulfacinum hydrothermale DSM 13146]
MKIAIVSDGRSLDAQVGDKLALSSYVLVVDLDTMKLEVVPLLSSGGGAAAAIKVISIALQKGAMAVLGGYISPRVSSPLMEHGIEVVTGVTGQVCDAVDSYKKGKFSKSFSGEKAGIRTGKDEQNFVQVLKKTAKQFSSIFPMLAGVVFLIGLFHAFVHKRLLFSIFSGKPLHDTVLGAFGGSVFAGNPINSYVIGDTLLKMGVSPYAVSALIVTWVTVGLVQLPAEIGSLGPRFALVRNGTAFLASIIIAFLTVYLVRILS